MQANEAALAVKAGTLTEIPLSNIVPDVGGLRDVDKKNQQWKDLLGSIRVHGIQEPIQVRRNHGAAEGEPGYIIINGLHRFTAAKELLDEENAQRVANGQDPADPSTLMIPAVVVEVETEEEVYLLQLHTNIQNVTTRPLQILHHCLSIIASRDEAGNPITQAELAEILQKSEAYVSNILRLKKLDEDTATLVSEGKIKAAQAYSLAKLPAEEHAEWVERAQTMDSQDFDEAVRARVLEIKKADKANAPSRDEFRAIAKFVGKAKGLEMMNQWYQKHIEAHADELDQKVNFNTLDFQAGVYYGMQLLFELDSDTLAAKKAKHEAEVRERNRKKAAADAAKDAQTAAERGVHVLVPKGHRAPIGFGSTLKDLEEEGAEEAQEAPANA